MDSTDNEKKLKQGLLMAVGLLVVLSVLLIFNMVQNNACESIVGGNYMLQSDCDLVIEEVCDVFGSVEPTLPLFIDDTSDENVIMIDIVG